MVSSGNHHQWQKRIRLHFLFQYSSIEYEKDPFESIDLKGSFFEFAHLYNAVCPVNFDESQDRVLESQNLVRKSQIHASESQDQVRKSQVQVLNRKFKYLVI